MSGGDFWARRKAAVAAEAEAGREAIRAREAATLEARPDEDILAELGLKDPDTLEPGDDFAAFLNAAVPERLKRRALRRLWRTNPALANLDALVDYGEDYTDAAMAAGNVKTAYQVGKGMLAHIVHIAPEPAEDFDAAPDADAPAVVAEAAPAPIEPQEPATTGQTAPAACASISPQSPGGIDRMSATTARHVIPEEERLRADLYDFLGTLLAAPPDSALLSRTARLSGDDTGLGRAISGLARVAGAVNARAVESEFNALFIGLGRGELLPYGSYYMTGFLHEKPLARLRADMVTLGIGRAVNVFEPEDNIASLLDMMAGMILGRFGEPVPLESQKEFFTRHIAPWAGHFFADLEGAQSSIFYASVGAAGRAFMDIEARAFRMSGE